ncbi:HEAT repeat domain-containing protein [Peptostreptococcus faecalis]|uniref:HEAT repeat domain-containing protein n=1 Tax=Peptostreptococcus faecalis TaxID=2045015 RepID=UPI000C7BAB09|nr:HEAT repeat domain-containing protein [Peptostreptococcus faecalis]
MVIGWENIDNLDDYYITYLLYKESRTVLQISKIRNKSVEDVNDDLIKAKLSIREYNKSKETKVESIIEYYLSLSKDDRLKYIKNMSEYEYENFKKDVHRGILDLQNIDDLIVLVWTAGELKDSEFLKLIYPLTEKKHSNMRRIAYSAIGKIGDKESVSILELGLLDTNPQVRQYCARYLGNIGSKSSIRILENLVTKKADFEKEYVLRAAQDSLEKLYLKFEIRK